MLALKKKGFRLLFTFTIKALIYTHAPADLAHFTHSVYKDRKVIGQRLWYIYSIKIQILVNFSKVWRPRNIFQCFAANTQLYSCLSQRDTSVKKLACSKEV